jgi:Zn-dependent protease with chaperone function
MNKTVYPASPVISDYSFLQPSKDFRQQVQSMISGIAIFIVMYLALIALSVALLLACGALGIGVISFRPSLITLAIGLGLIALGLMVFLFLIKFIFSRTKDEDPLQVEIYERDHPELFRFIRQITEEVKTDFPKRIFLTPDVNAAVFYNSSFWSMFLPIRKNLRIGLGLVNSLNVSEFKATLAHEFGHFSQRSTKLGSYVYTANKVIFNLVTTRDRWDEMLERWASTGGVFGFFALVTFRLVQQVRALLAYMYQKLNVRYMALSREMEYHADLVAVSAAGNQSLVQTLRKIEFTDNAYQQTLSMLNDLIGKEKKSVNLYALHRYIIGRLAQEFKIKLKDGMPLIEKNDLETNIQKSRLNVKDQWASHPSLEERESNVRKVNLSGEMIEQSAWIIFSDVEKYQRILTEQVYNGVPQPPKEWKDLSESEFISYAEGKYSEIKLPAEFKGFYDDRFLKEFDLEEARKGVTDRAFEEIFADDTREFFKRYSINQSDLGQLEGIQHTLKKNEVFEFDHQKKVKSDIPALVSSLKDELAQSEKTNIDLDRHAFQFFHKRAVEQNRAEELVLAYRSVFDWQKKMDQVGEYGNKIQFQLYRLQSQTEWTEIQQKELCQDLSALEEGFKRTALELPFESIINKVEEPRSLEDYLTNKTLFYMSVVSFNQEGFEKLYQKIFIVMASVSEKRFQALKDLTELQSQLIK